MSFNNVRCSADKTKVLQIASDGTFIIGDLWISTGTLKMIAYIAKSQDDQLGAEAIGDTIANGKLCALLYSASEVEFVKKSGVSGEAILEGERVYAEVVSDQLVISNNPTKYPCGVALESKITTDTSIIIDFDGTLNAAGGNYIGIDNIDFSSCGGADGAPLAAAETAGDFFKKISTNDITMNGEATISETEVSKFLKEYKLPPNYVPGGAIAFKTTVAIVGAGTPGACTLDMEIYPIDEEGAAGADICLTTIATVVSDGTFNEITWNLTTAGIAALVAGAKLLIRGTSSIVESTGAAIAINVGQFKAELLLAKD